LLKLAWARHQLPAINTEWREYERAVGELLICSVLPLYYSFRTLGSSR